MEIRKTYVKNVQIDTSEIGSCISRLEMHINDHFSNLAIRQTDTIANREDDLTEVKAAG